MSTTALRQAQARAWTVWTVTVALMGGLVMFGFRGDSPENGLIELGMIFAGYVLAMGVIARRAKDVSTLLVIAWGGTFGMWATRWLDMSGRAVDHFLPKLGVLSPQLIDAMDMPAAIAGAGLVSAALLLVATTSTRVAWSCVCASLIASAVPLVSEDPSLALPWAALAWHATIAGSLAFWAVDESMRGSGARCRSCGNDVQGLSSPVCPRCASPLARGRGVPALATQPAQMRRPL